MYKQFCVQTGLTRIFSLQYLRISTYLCLELQHNFQLFIKTGKRSECASELCRLCKSGPAGHNLALFLTSGLSHHAAGGTQVRNDLGSSLSNQTSPAFISTKNKQQIYLPRQFAQCGQSLFSLWVTGRWNGNAFSNKSRLTNDSELEMFASNN